MFLAGGLSIGLTHHVMHATGSRMWGFTQELFDSTASPNGEAQAEVPPNVQAVRFQQMSVLYPNILQIATAARHDDDSVVGHGCDDQFEFEFTLDLLLEGFERLHRQAWTSKHARPERGYPVVPNPHGSARRQRQAAPRKWQAMSDAETVTASVAGRP